MNNDQKRISDLAIDVSQGSDDIRIAHVRNCDNPPSSNSSFQSCEYPASYSGSDCQTHPGSALGFLLNDASRLYRQSFESVVEEAGFALTAGEARSLSFVAAFRGSRQTSLAAHMGIRPMTLSSYINILEQQGLVVRSPDPTDRRANLVFITKKADAILEALQAASDEVYGKATARLTAKQIQETEYSLLILIRNLS